VPRADGRGEEGEKGNGRGGGQARAVHTAAVGPPAGRTRRTERRETGEGDTGASRLGRRVRVPRRTALRRQPVRVRSIHVSAFFFMQSYTPIII